MKLGAAIAEIMKREGIEILCGYPVNHLIEYAAAADIRPVIVRQERIGEFDVALANEFFVALANNAKINLHIKEFSGGNAHHVIEASMKALARAMRAALVVSGNELPSTKGML